MDVLLATEITPAMLVSSTAPERLEGQVEWSNIAWPIGSVVTREVTRRVYKAAYDVPAGGVPPEENIAAALLPFWADIQPMNQWAMFDGQARTQTVGPAGDLVVVLKPGVITDFWVGNLADSLTVHIVLRDKSGGSIVYEQTRGLARKVTTYWEWWFGPFVMAGDSTFTGIPAYRQGEVTLTLSAGVGGAARVGMVAVGKTENLGKTEWGVDADYRNYSARNLNQAWGPSQATEGEVTKDITYRVYVKPEEAPRVDAFAKRAMKRPAIWLPSGKPEFEGIRIFGQAISARMGYPGPNYVPFDITIREFI